MEARTVTETTKPTYRVFITPTRLVNRVDPTDKTVQQLIENPPATRQSGWTIWPTTLSYDDKQLIGKGPEGTVLTLLFNGHLEYWEPVLSRRWQWLKSKNEAAEHPELFPYALCEITVNFFRLARQLHNHLKVDGDVEAELALYDIQGFTLKPYNPDIIGYMETIFHQPPYKKADLKSGVIKRAHDFDPDQLSLALLERIYGQFGYKREHIPFFDQEGRFTLQ